MRSATVQDGDLGTSACVRGFFVTSFQVSCSGVTACSSTVRRVANSLLYLAAHKIGTVLMQASQNCIDTSVPIKLSLQQTR